MLSINSEFSGITFKVEFKDKINLFNGNSGEGKTFMFKTLKTYLKFKGVSCLYVGNEMLDLSLEEMKLVCRGKSVIIFDKADLYLTQELLDTAIEIADTIIISMKIPYELGMSNIGFYSLHYEADSLCTKRRNIY